jgi:hypothetical protein
MALHLAACASADSAPVDPDAPDVDEPEDGSAGEPGEDAAEGRDVPQPPSDIDGPDEDIDSPPDDTGGPMPDAPASADVPDFSGCDAIGTQCTPLTSYCLDATKVEFCDRCGFVFDSETCPADEICDSAGTGRAACRTCVGAECVRETSCEPDTVQCLDYRTQQLCGPDGTVASTSPCRDGRRCTTDGSCGPVGLNTGAACTTDVDPAVGCAGQRCICGTQYREEVGSAACTGPLANGYCTTTQCEITGCDPESEACVAFSRLNLYGRQNHCVRTERCTAAGRFCGGIAGLNCQDLPTLQRDGTQRWAMVCWPNLGLARVSGTCTGSSDCSGGACVTSTTGGVSTSYCAATCASNGECPSNARCVEDPRSSRTGGICLARANVTDCPRLSNDINVRSINAREIGDGRPVDVCFIPVR